VPFAMVAAERVMMRDRASEAHHRRRDRPLDVPELLDQTLLIAKAVIREIRRRTVRIDVRKAAARRSRTSGYILHGLAHRIGEVLMEILEAIPRDAGFERLTHDATRDRVLAVVRRTNE